MGQANILLFFWNGLLGHVLFTLGLIWMTSGSALKTAQKVHI